MNLIAELRKRNVFRVVAAYLVASWIIVQVVGFVAGATEMPPWVDTFALIVVLLGLPIVVIAAWALELTPDGIKASGTETELEPRPIGPVDYVLIAAVVVVLGLFGWQMVAPSGEGATRVTAEQIEGTSIAVMPFVAMSGAEEDAYLGDGLAEELLNVLAQFPDLMVAGRTSSFSFRHSDEGIQEIGTALGVSHVLEGSVRRAGDQLRVTAQLIRSSDGFHVWSGTYDRPFSDVLSVQDDIVRQIAQVLAVRLGVGSAMRTEAMASPAAYEQYLQGRYLFAERHVDENRRAATTAFQTSVDIDPSFAAGWAALGRAIVYSSGAGEGDYFDEVARAQRAAERALELDPNNAEAHVALSQADLRVTRDWAGSQSHVDRALEIAPNAAFVHYQAGFHFEYLGEVDRAASAFRRAIALDPLNLTIRDNAAEAFVRMYMFDDARNALIVAGMAPSEIAETERDIGFATGDADLIVTSYAAMDATDPSLGGPNDFMAPFRDELRALSLARARGDRAAMEAALPVALEALGEHPNSGSLMGFRSLMYFQAEDYRNAAIDLTNASFGPFDEVVYLDLVEQPIAYLCQPAYHTIWERPGIPELMEIRRANGRTGNLPRSGPECDEYLEAAE